MKFFIAEFNKSSSASLNDVQTNVQTMLNDNNNLVSFKAYENLCTNKICFELLFGSIKTKSQELFLFGPDEQIKIVRQLNEIMALANTQNKNVGHAGLVTMSKSPRVVGFLILEKDNIEEQKTEQNGKRKTKS